MQLVNHYDWSSWIKLMIGEELLPDCDSPESIDRQAT